MDASFPRLSHPTALLVIKDLGFSATDIGVMAGYQSNHPEVVVEDPDGSAEAVLRALDLVELEVADVFAILGDPFSELAVNHPDELVREESRRQFEQILRFARRLEPPGVTILPGVVFEGIDPQESRALAARELQFRAEVAKDAGLALSVEPHYQSIASTPTETLELLEQAPDLTLTLDYSHFIYQGIGQAEVDELIPRSRHLHLRPAAPGDMQTRAGEGTIDFDAVVERLAQDGYAGYLGIEFCWEEWMGLNDADCVSETAVLRELMLATFDRRNTSVA